VVLTETVTLREDEVEEYLLSTEEYLSEHLPGKMADTVSL
jgi:hypothetical protein